MKSSKTQTANMFHQVVMLYQLGSLQTEPELFV